MAFRKKAVHILKYKPDILVVPECEHPDKLNFVSRTNKPKQILWFGENKNKGLGVFCYCDLKLEVLDVYNSDFKMVVPISVKGGSIEFNLFAVWANNPNDKDGQYVTQVWKAINHYDHLLKSSPSILTGDFNSNAIWDKKNRPDTHSNVVEYLRLYGIVSLYHSFHNQVHGEEKHATFYLYKHKNKPYHLDYCFGSECFLARVESVVMGRHSKWAKFSDHSPVIVTIKE